MLKWFVFGFPRTTSVYINNNWIKLESVQILLKITIHINVAQKLNYVKLE